MFKCMCSSGVVGHLLFVLRYISALRGAAQLQPGSTLGCMEDAQVFLSSSLLLLSWSEREVSAREGRNLLRNGACEPSPSRLL